jgi:hypothetical protein
VGAPGHGDQRRQEIESDTEQSGHRILQKKLPV